MMGAFEIGSYIFAIVIGLIFTGLGLFFMIFKKGEPLYFGEYVVIGAWIAHSTWNILVDLHFAVYGTPLQLFFGFAFIPYYLLNRKKINNIEKLK